MYPLPTFEAERIRELKTTQLLDSEPEIEFDAIVELARDFFEVPICLLSLIDEKRQWFKANRGLDACETPREHAFCSYTILKDDLLVVEDARLDARFASNPLVWGPPYIRFYAGAPLTVRAGIAVGTLCIVDTKPRSLSEDHRRRLSHLSRSVTGLVQSRRYAAEAAELARETWEASVLLEERSQQLAIKERLFRYTERLAKVGAFEVNLKNGAADWSDGMYALYEFPLGSVVTFESALSACPPAQRVRVASALQSAIEKAKGFEGDFEICVPSGVRKTIRAIGDVGLKDGKPHWIRGIAQDITDRVLAEKVMWETANRDALTGLANRNRFESELEEAFSSGANRPGLLLVDADRLKDVNDTMGHGAGDHLLRTIADRLTGTIWPGDRAFRIGGDEFAVIVSDPLDEADLELRAKAILRAMEDPFVTHEASLKPSVSIGGAIGDLARGAETLRQNADIALYKSKEFKSGYAAYHDGMRSAITTRMANMRIVDAALEAGGILSWYQPVMEAATFNVASFEVLCRLRHAGEIKSIGEFPEALQDFKIGSRLTKKVLAAVETDIAGWRAAGFLPPSIAVNVGMPDFLEGDLEERICAFAEHCQLPLSKLTVEVTESVFLSQGSDLVTRTTRRLREQGVIVALDDFGTGYASLAHLATFPVDVIKLDRSFVAHLGRGGPGSAISTAIVDLSKRIGLQVVAEGVETEEQAHILRDLGCHKLQGYLFSKAISAEHVPPFLLRFCPLSRTA